MMYKHYRWDEHCVWERQTEQGLWDQIVLINENRDKIEGLTSKK